MIILLCDVIQLQCQFRWTYLRMQLLRWETVRTVFGLMEHRSTTARIGAHAVL